MKTRVRLTPRPRGRAALAPLPAVGMASQAWPGLMSGHQHGGQRSRWGGVTSGEGFLVVEASHGGWENRRAGERGGTRFSANPLCR